MYLKPNTAILNLPFAEERIRELGLKRQAISRRIGVHRNTVRRWLNGEIKWVYIGNLIELAKVLNCQLDDLILNNEAELLASRLEQKEAAHIVLQEDLPSILKTEDKYQLLEAILKMALQPNLDQKTLCQFLIHLADTALMLGKIQESQGYLEKARNLVQNLMTGGEPVEDFDIQVSKVNAKLLIYLDQLAAAKQFLHLGLRLKDNAANKAECMFLLGLAFFHEGEIHNASGFLKQTLEQLKPLEFRGIDNLRCRTWLLLAQIYILKSESEKAEIAHKSAEKLAFEGGLGERMKEVQLIGAYLAAHKGYKSKAIEEISDWLERFDPSQTEHLLLLCKIYRFIDRINIARKIIQDLDRGYPQVPLFRRLIQEERCLIDDNGVISSSL